MVINQSAQPSGWRWYAGSAVLTYILGYLAGAFTGDALLYVAGALLALAILVPLWMKQPRYLLIALVIYLPLEDAILQAFTTHTVIERVVPDILLLLAFGIRLALARLRRDQVFGTPLDLPLLVIVLVALVSFYVNHVHVSVAAQGVYVLVRYALVFYLAASSRFTERDVQVLVRMLVAVAALQCFVGAVQFALLRLAGFHLYNFEFVQGTIGYSNTFGMFLTIACVLALACYSPSWVQRPRALLALLIASSAAVMILALSRQSLVSLAIGWIGVALLGRQYLRLRSFHLPLAAATGVAIVGFSALMLVASPAPTSSASRTGSQARATATAHVGQSTVTPIASATPSPHPAPKPTASSGTNAYDRFIGDKAKKSGLSSLLSTNFYQNSRLYEIANGGQAILQQSPVVGFGPGTFGGQATFKDHAFYERLHVGLLLSDPHHTYVADVEWMTIFGQLGLVGLLAFIALFIQIWRLARRAFTTSGLETTRRLAIATMALIPVWLAVGFTGPNFELRPVSIWIWLLPGIVLSLLRQERQAAIDEKASVTTESLGRLRSIP